MTPEAIAWAAKTRAAYAGETWPVRMARWRDWLAYEARARALGGEPRGLAAIEWERCYGGPTPDDVTGGRPCAGCGTVVPAGVDVCPGCGDREDVAAVPPPGP